VRPMRGLVENYLLAIFFMQLSKSETCVVEGASPFDKMRDTPS
jgi:hypothetical protein